MRPLAQRIGFIVSIMKLALTENLLKHWFKKQKDQFLIEVARENHLTQAKKNFNYWTNRNILLNQGQFGSSLMKYIFVRTSYNIQNKKWLGHRNKPTKPFRSHFFENIKSTHVYICLWSLRKWRTKHKSTNIYCNCQLHSAKSYVFDTNICKVNEVDCKPLMQYYSVICCTSIFVTKFPPSSDCLLVCLNNNLIHLLTIDSFNLTDAR